MSFKFFAAIVLFIFPFSPFSIAQELWSPEHVYYGKGGVLTYTPDEKGNIIPDFSHVGYRYGDEPIPWIETLVEIEPVEGDDGAAIQAAIQSLYHVTPDENGFRGAVLLKKGTYRVSGQIRIAASGIVLRGEGDTDDGTVIIAEGTSQRDLIRVDNGASRTIYSNTRVAINEDYVPVGRKYVIVTNASGYAPGDNIVLYRPGTTQWISDIRMNQISAGEGVTQWSPSAYSFYFERLVTKVNGDTIFFRNPVVMAMETKYGGGSVYKYSFNRLQNIGIEGICFKSVYAHSTDEDHSWSAIAINNTENSWVRNVTAWYFALSCVRIESMGRLITVENSHSRDQKSVITGGRRYPFQTSGALNLFKGLTSTEARHDYATGARVCGPNVFMSSTAANTHNDIGPHHRWAMGSLYDYIVSDGPINVQDRDNWGTGHGWSGANHVLWNCQAGSATCQNPWASAKNYNFGFIGTKSKGRMPDRPDGEWVGHNVPGIFPVSLYEAQLDERLNGTTLFSAVSQLHQLNDTTFLIRFTLPLKPEQINSDYFVVTGTIDIEKDEFTPALYDEYSVSITSGGFKNLPDMATILVRAENLTSQSGKPLQGITAASVTLPDLRPFVTGVSKFTDNINGFVEASSTKPGTIYFVKYGVNAKTLAELDSLINANMGRKVAAPDAETSVTIYTKGLPGGYYEYYAVDHDNRVSVPSTTWVSVDQFGPVTGVEIPLLHPGFTAFLQNRQIVVDPGNDTPFSLEIYTVVGQVVYKGTHLTGTQRIDPGNNRGVLIIRKRSASGFAVLKMVVE